MTMVWTRPTHAGILLILLQLLLAVVTANGRADVANDGLVLAGEDYRGHGEHRSPQPNTLTGSDSTSSPVEDDADPSSEEGPSSEEQELSESDVTAQEVVSDNGPLGIIQRAFSGLLRSRCFRGCTMFSGDSLMTPVKRNAHGEYLLELSHNDKLYFQRAYTFDRGELRRLFAGSQPFKLLRVAGEGGFAVVYLGTHGKRERWVALKLPDMRNIDTVINEVAVLNAMMQAFGKKASKRREFALPLGVYWVRDDMGQKVQLIIVMEYFESDVVRQVRYDGAQRFSTTRTIAQTMFSGLAKMHAAGIVHCDVKPENLLYARPTRRVPNGRVVIADFGLSRLLADVRLSRSPCGTPLCMAPELVFMQKRDEKIDVWSAGVTLFNVATGRLFYGSMPSGSPGEDIRNMRHAMTELFGGRKGLPLIDTSAVLHDDRQSSEAYKTAYHVRQAAIQKMLEKTIIHNGDVRMSMDQRQALADLLSRILVWSPDERLSAAEVLKHPFFRMK